MRIFSAQTVTLSTTTSGATIRYTTDGSTPSETNGTVYSSPVVISATTTLQAIAYLSGMLDSTVASGVYRICTVQPPSAGLVAWYSGLNVPEGSSNITSWADASGNGFTATGAASYAASVASLNNMPAVYFNGAQTMVTANMSSLFSSSTGGMLFVLYQPNVSGDFAYISQNNAGTTDTHDRFSGTNAYLNAFMNATAAGAPMGIRAISRAATFRRCWRSSRPPRPAMKPG